MIIFKSLLWWSFVSFTLICISFCLEAHHRYKNKNGIDNNKEFLNRYEYFGQPVFNKENKIQSYELLLREFNPKTHEWQLPDNVTNFPLSKIINTIQKINPQLEAYSHLSLNMTVSQIIDFRTDYFFTWLFGTTNIKELVIELDAEDIRHTSFAQRRKIFRILKNIKHPQIRVTIENVDSSKKTYLLLQQYLPYIHYLKFNIHTFNKSANHWIDVTLAQWKRRSAHFNVESVVGKIEDTNNIALVDQLDISLRQGYAYGRPKNLNK